MPMVLVHRRRLVYDTVMRVMLCSLATEIRPGWLVGRAMTSSHPPPTAFQRNL